MVNWKKHIKVKHIFEKDPDNNIETLKEMSQQMINALDKESEFETVIDGFKKIIRKIDNKSYDYEDAESAFNRNLEEMYGIADYELIWVD